MPEFTGNLNLREHTDRPKVRHIFHKSLTIGKYVGPATIEDRQKDLNESTYGTKISLYVPEPTDVSHKAKIFLRMSNPRGSVFSANSPDELQELANFINDCLVDSADAYRAANIAVKALERAHVAITAAYAKLKAKMEGPTLPLPEEVLVETENPHRPILPIRLDPDIPKEWDVVDVTIAPLDPSTQQPIKADYEEHRTIVEYPTKISKIKSTSEPIKKNKRRISAAKFRKEHPPKLPEEVLQ